MIGTEHIRNDIFRIWPEEAINKKHEDDRKRVYLTPTRVLWKTDNSEAKVVNSDVLTEKRSPQISMEAKNPCIMVSQKGYASVLLDFGRELHGGIVIFAWSDSTKRGAKVRIRFGESAMEAMSEIGGPENATNDHANRDLIVRVGSMSMTPIGETGFRFVRIDLLEENQELVLKAIQAVMIYKDLEYKGSFSCSDKLLDRIWDTGAYTAHLSMQNYIWDGIKRDRLLWAGDMHPETTTIQTVFGSDETVMRSLEFVKEETPLPGWMNGFPAYSMWWIIIQRDWFMHTGNLDYLEKQKEYLIGLEKQLSEAIDENGKDCTPEVRFIDWPTLEDKEVVDCGLQALHVMAVKSLGYMLDILGEKKLAQKCSEDIKRLSKWKGNYKQAKQAAALSVLAGLENARTVNEKLLKVGKSEGLSTFMGYYILNARAMAGDIDGCLECIREYWGGMLSLGATTFWEDFDVKWLKNAAPIDEIIEKNSEKINVHACYGKYCYKGYRHSLCHGWASGVTAWITENILGVKILEPGCKKIKIQPQLGNLQWAKGTYPTPYGILVVEHRKDAEGKIKTDVKAPKEIEVIVEI